MKCRKDVAVCISQETLRYLRLRVCPLNSFSADDALRHQIHVRQGRMQRPRHNPHLLKVMVVVGVVVMVMMTIMVMVVVMMMPIMTI